MVNEKNSNFRIPARLWIKVIAASLRLHPRSFAADARAAVSGVLPGTDIRGLENIPRKGPCLVMCNHHTRPGLDAWWGPLLISVIVSEHRYPQADTEIHWVMTAAWTFPEHPWRNKYLTPVTRWMFERIAQVYGFITMPPMPPAPDELYARATAVRKTLRLARTLVPNGGMIGLAPEGRDTPDVVGTVPEGAGDFIAHLCKTGMPILPAGVSDFGESLCVSFGPSFLPEIPTEKTDRDLAISQQVMDAIRKLTT